MAIDWTKVGEALPKPSRALFDEVRSAYDASPDDLVAATRQVDKLLIGKLASLRSRLEALKKEVPK